jgi:hypothetical protein
LDERKSLLGRADEPVVVPKRDRRAKPASEDGVVKNTPGKRRAKATLRWRELYADVHLIEPHHVPIGPAP